MELFCPLILTPEEKEVLLLTAPMHTPPHTVRLWEVNCINVFPEQKTGAVTPAFSKAGFH